MLRTIASLDEVPEEDRECYEAQPDGTYKLAPEISEVLDRHEAEIAEKQAELERLGALLDAHVKARDLRNALVEAGVDGRHVRKLIPYLETNLALTVREEGDEHVAYVQSPFGLVSVASAVSTWLASPDGDDYRPKPRNNNVIEGKFGVMARGLSIH